MGKELNNIEIGERIRAIREEMFLSREKFSELIDISDVFLGQIERGESSLSLKTLSSIVSYSGASTDYILFGDETQNSYTKRINRILSHSSEYTSKFIYKMISEIHSFTKNYKN